MCSISDRSRIYTYTSIPIALLSYHIIALSWQKTALIYCPVIHYIDQSRISHSNILSHIVR